MKVLRSALLVLFGELGFKTADKWNIERLKSKVGQLSGVIDDETQPTTDASKALLSKLLKLEDPDTLEVIEDTVADDTEDAPAKPVKKAKPEMPPVADDTEDAPAKPVKKAKPEMPPVADDTEDAPAKPVKKAKAAPVADDTEDAPAKPVKKAKAAPVADDTEDETVPVKPKGKRPQKAGGEGGPGVISTIVECLKKATEKKPATKADILAVLCERFPDRPSDSMARTINVQLPGRIRADKGLNVVKSEKGGYYVAKDE